MSKLKVLEINKQLKTSADATLNKYNDLLKNAQESISVVKKLEADLIKQARAQAEENKMKKQEEKIEKDRLHAEEQIKAKSEERKALDVADKKALEDKAAVTKDKAETKIEKEEVPVKTPERAMAKDSAKQEEKTAEPAKTVVENKSQTKNDERPKAAVTKRANTTKSDRPAQNRPAQNNRSNQNNSSQNARPNQAANNRPAQGNYNQNRGQQQSTNKAGYTQVRGNAPGQGNNRGGYNKPGQGGKGANTDNRFGRKNKRSFNRNNIDIYKDDANMRGPRKPKKQKEVIVIETKIIENAVITSENVSVKVLAESIGKPVADILKKLMLLGMMCNINSEIDFDTAQLICTEFKITLEQKLGKTAEDVLDDEDKEDDNDDLTKRPPVVTIMGHVDHGKTSLLDAIRETKVTEGEAGGITQHIGAYTVKSGKEPITFLDTPGHEAFTSMRARGAQVTDIAILVVAADDGVMPQTVEAINHAKDAGVPIIVAINKIDRPNASVEKIKQELTEHEILAEEWGGDTVMVPVSAITKEGIEKLLEMILIVSEMLELKANADRLAKGTIIEAKLDKGRGPVATVLVTNGTLRVQYAIIAGTTQGRVRAMVNDDGKPVIEAGPSIPVEVIGFSEVPLAGDVMHAVDQDKLSRKVVQERKDKVKADKLKNMSKVSLEDLFEKIAEGQLKNLNIVVKADVQGSAEAIRQALEKIKSDEVKINVKQTGVGAISEADVLLASVANAIIIGFNVRPDNMARAAAEREKVDLRLYRVIYDAIEDIEKAMIGMLDPEFKEAVLGHVEVRELYKVSNIGTIAGCYVLDGKVNRSAQLRLLRDNIVIHEGEIGTLRRFKDDVKEVLAGYECGVSLNNYNNIEVGDIIEAFEMQKVER